MFVRYVSSRVKCDVWDCYTTYDGDIVEIGYPPREEFLGESERALLTEAIKDGWSVWPDRKINRWVVNCPEHTQSKLAQ